MAKTVSLTATRRMRYANRSLNPGDDFMASPRDARLLKGLKKAADKRQEGELAPPSPDLAKKIDAVIPPSPPAPPLPSVEEELKTAREAYEAKFNRKPHHRWDAATIRAKIDEASATS